MKKPRMLAYALLSTALAGCASPLPIGIGAYQDQFGGGKTYAITPSAVPQSDAVQQAQQQSLAPALASHALGPAPMASADYLVTLGYANRDSSMVVHAQCTLASDFSQACEYLGTPPTDFFGRKYYLHLLTIQFVERKSGNVRYQVTAAHFDRDPQGDNELHGLIACALTDFPLPNGTRRELKNCD